MNFLMELGREIAADPHEHATKDPLFRVMRKRRIYGLDPENAGNNNLVWLANGEYDYPEVDPWEFIALEQSERGGWDNIPVRADIMEKHIRTAFFEVEEFVTAFLTQSAAEEFCRTQTHWYPGCYFYVDSLYRNPQMSQLREALMALGGAA